MSESPIPYNKVGSDAPQTTADIAEREGISEEEWRARNLPSEKLEFRWRYTNKTIHLYERRLRSLGAFNIGPAVQAWIRSRLEWMRDNKLYEVPDGVLVLTIDPEGDVDVQMEALSEVPEIGSAEAAGTAGTLWVARGGKLHPAEPPRQAADTFARDLVTTLGYEIVDEPLDEQGAELFAVSDEFGIVPVGGTQGPVTEKLAECFEKLWTLKK